MIEIKLSSALGLLSSITDQRHFALSLPVRRLRTGLDAFVVKSLAKFQSLK